MRHSSSQCKSRSAVRTMTALSEAIDIRTRWISVRDDCHIVLRRSTSRSISPVDICGDAVKITSHGNPGKIRPTLRCPSHDTFYPDVCWDFPQHFQAEKCGSCHQHVHATIPHKSGEKCIGLLSLLPRLRNLQSTDELLNPWEESVALEFNGRFPLEKQAPEMTPLA
jgi:hypothetical protein